MAATGATLDTENGLNLNPVGTYTLKDASSLLDALTLINMSSELAPLYKNSPLKWCKITSVSESGHAVANNIDLLRD